MIAGLEAHRESRTRNSGGGNAIRSDPDSPNQTPPRKRNRDSPDQAPPSSPPYTVDMLSTYGLDGFLASCGEMRVTEIYKARFFEGGIADVRLINERDLRRSKMLDLGFNEMLTTMLYKNAAKYCRKLKREQEV